MNNDQILSNQEEIKLSIKDISAEARGYMTQLQAHRSEIQGQLGLVEVDYSPINRPDLAKAVKDIFGIETLSQSDTSKKAITLQMYLDCLEILRKAGKYKAEQIIADKVF